MTGSPPNLVVLSNMNKQFGNNSAFLSSATLLPFLFVSAGGAGLSSKLGGAEQSEQAVWDISTPLSSVT